MLVCGDALTASPPAPSLVISRSTAGSQTFLPTRLLQGLLPAALLEKYVFWQSERDHSVEGYPSAALLSEPDVAGKHAVIDAGAPSTLPFWKLQR